MKKTQTIKRDTAFMKVCMQTALELSSGRYTPTTEVIVSVSLKKPAPRYYTTLEQAMTNIRGILNRKISSAEKLKGRKKMWYEILGKLHERNGFTPKGEIKPHALNWIIHNSRASGFFLSKSYAIRLYREVSAASKIIAEAKNKSTVIKPLNP